MYKSTRPHWLIVRDGWFKNGKLLVNKNNFYYNEMIEGSYDNYLYNGIERKDFSGKLMIDIGGHIGYHTLCFSRMVGENGKVITCEPNPFNVTRIEEHIKENGIKNVEIVRSAVSDKEGKAVFNFSKNVDNMTSSGGYVEGTKTPLSDAIYNRAGFVKEQVKVDTLDNILGKVKLPIALIKIDVEGHEANVLYGAKNILQTQKPIILLEIHTIKAMHDCEKYLRSFGYDSEILFEESDGRLFLKYIKK
jgi:FkbM family methyltransferase